MPFPKFDTPYTTVVEDRKGNLLGASIADDGQWRFPPSDTVSEKFRQAILHFEDQYFYQHPGFNPVSLIRAAYQNVSAGSIVSGGSTLTMQVIRLARKKDRTIVEKLREILLATRLELALSKDEILNLYASQAPFGGNIVGLDAAAWRYFGVQPAQLSWAESALLAVLPNSPALLYPGKNEELLLRKRNRLLNKLYTRQVIDSLTLQLALGEPLPSAPHPLPQKASHLLTRVLQEGKKGTRVATTVEASLQQQVTALVKKHSQKLRGNHIYNAAALVVDVKTGQTQAYVGNSEPGVEHGSSVDIITAPRSTGSVLKPILYAAMLHEGGLLPHSLVPDIPTYIDGFVPQNFSKQFEGAVPADQVVSRSLNVPAVRMLQDYGVEKLHHKLKQFGMTTLTQPPGHYGLSLILGGAEVTLWDLVGIYASMARSLNQYFRNPEPNRYSHSDIHPLSYEAQADSAKVSVQSEYGHLGASSLWFAFRAMQEVARPENETGWQYFSSSQSLAWKTGTSYGHRDAWAVGLTPRYVVGVWVGNADGEGRSGLTGVTAAAPLLFDIVQLMPATDWFDVPRSDMAKVVVSTSSGYRAPRHATDTISRWVPLAGLKTPISPYHQQVQLDASGAYQVQSNCESVHQMQAQQWFALPPVQEWYYQRKHPSYRPLPPYRADCRPVTNNRIPMDIIYPKAHAKIYIPNELQGERGRTIFEAAHRDNQQTLYWHVDATYLGETRGEHQMALLLEAGEHTLHVIDGLGNSLAHPFEIVAGED
ncbi:penicillin-binding protein 1C [Tunicatimonas pelagia]|uniref:penicillin-binding protein 1C n=1 Tax=Tunicatimonas pelagia TaxID=931531 RepID=UPI002666A5FB|nr:penicillin-binding protein 1C [Tunicatimonas pelagia]WKN42126.1 penicillin-binding protein 1C [Tunicatimonas pelagia]